MTQGTSVPTGAGGAEHPYMEPAGSHVTRLNLCHNGSACPLAPHYAQDLASLMEIWVCR